MICGARSQTLLLPREEFAKTLKGLKRLAHETPSALDDPDRVLAATTLEAALTCMGWQMQLDAHGDIVGLASSGNKLVEDLVTTVTGSEKVKPAPLAHVLAKTAHGSFVVTSDDAASTVVFQHGRAHGYDFARSAFEQIGEVRAAPGQTARVRFRLVGAMPAEHVSVHMVRTLGKATHKPPWSADGIAGIELDESPMALGDERELAVKLPSSAHGQVRVWVCTRSSKTYFRSTALTIDVDEPAGPDEWRVIEQTPARPLYVMLGPLDSKRALLHAQRFAARHASQPGGAFLRDVASAASLEDVFAAAHLEGTLQSRGSNLRIAGDRLPGPEHLFWGLLRALLLWVAPKWKLGIHEYAQLWVRYEHAPHLRYRYWIGSGGSRDVELADP